MRRIWDIHGGVHPPENKTQTNQQPIGSIPLPKEIILPLNQHIGAEAEAIVEVGQRVLKGEIVAEAQGIISANVHASTSGIVTFVGDRVVTHASGLTAPCVVIEPDGNEEWAALTPIDDYLNVDRKVLLDKIRESGIVGLGGAGFPSAVKMNPRGNHKIDTLILNGTECEPYITADDVLMQDHADDIVRGAELLAHMLHEPEHVLIGIEDNKPEAIIEMRRAVEGTRFEVVVFPTKYPSGGEKQLIQILTGREVPSEKLPSDIGVVVQNLGTAVAAYRAVSRGEPLISRITTVVGRSLNVQRNIEVLIGTPIEHILSEHGYQQENNNRLIIGGPMMGFAIEQLSVPVVKTTNCVLAPSKDEMPEAPPAQPCIRCGMCEQACPASLLPQQLLWFSQSEEFEKLEAHNLFDCIECGACSYVCPSNIPLVQHYRHAKSTIRQLEQDKIKSDRSRERFEARKARLEKIEAEKEAKRLARKKAAEQAKANAAKAPKPAPTVNIVEPTKAEGAAKPQEDPAKQRAKLHRALTSAQSRLERARTQLDNVKLEQQESAETDQARLDTLSAKIKQAELKVSEAQSKLNEFDEGGQSAINASIDKVKAKVELSALEKQQKTIATLESVFKPLVKNFKKPKISGGSTVDALQQGVDKLVTKLADAQKELAYIEQSNASETKASTDQNREQTLSAADLAIEKAKRKAAEQAAMSDEEKANAQKASLAKRLAKAKARLQKAEEENDDNLEAFRISVEKLEVKLNALEEA